MLFVHHIHAIQNKTSLANLRWPTRSQPIGGHFFTHGVCCSEYFVFCFLDRRRTPCMKIMTTYSAVAWWVNSLPCWLGWPDGSLMTLVLVQQLIKLAFKSYKTGVIIDPFSQPTVPAGSDFRLILHFWDWHTDVRMDNMCEYSDH